MSTSNEKRGRGRPSNASRGAAANVGGAASARGEVIDMPSTSSEQRTSHVVVAQAAPRRPVAVAQVQQADTGARPAEVFERLEVLSASVVQLEQTTAALVAQLRPVLSMEDADGMRAAPATGQARTAIGEQLNSLDSRIRALNETVNATLQALEI